MSRFYVKEVVANSHACAVAKRSGTPGTAGAYSKARMGAACARPLRDSASTLALRVLFGLVTFALAMGVSPVFAYGQDGNPGGALTASAITETTDISGATIEVMPTVTYNGSAREPLPVVTLGGTTLVAGTDYALSYANNTAAGVATVIVEGKGAYEGKSETQFVINKASSKAAKMSPIPKQVYTGDAVTPQVTVTAFGKTLVPGTDYDLFYYGNAGVGTATAVAMLKGNFEGMVKGTFSIASATPAQIAQAAVTKDVAAACANYTDADPKGSAFSRLQLRVPKASKKSIKLSWKKVKGAAYYVLLGNQCGKGKKYVELKTFKPSKKAFTVKKLASGAKLKPGKSYKFLLLAFNKAGKRIATSKTVHVFTVSKKYGNVRKVTLNKKAKSLMAGKTFKLKAKVYKQKGKKLQQHRKVRFESSNKAVASVGAKTGKVTAKKAGTCYIYAYACDGKFTRCKVTVK